MRLFAAGVLCALLLMGGPALAGGAGTESPFSMGAGARALSLAGADLFYCDPSGAAYWNPSVLARAERYSLEAFHSDLYGSQTGYQYFGLAVPTVDFGGFGVGMFRLGIDGIEKRDASNYYLGEIGDSRLGLYLGYGHALSKYDIGMALTVEHHAPDVYSSTSSPGITLAVGRRFQLGSGRIPELGATIIGRNLVRPGIKIDEQSVTYPYSFDGAVSVKSLPLGNEDHRLMLSGRVTKVEQLDPRVAFALEYSLKDAITVRAGVRDGEAAFGFGFFYKYLGFDYAMVGRDLGTLHTFSLTASFGVPVSEKRRAREERREAEFNRLLGKRLADSNQHMVQDLVSRGQEASSSDDLAQAATFFDRALFVAAGAGMDTVEVAMLAALTRERLEIKELNEAFMRNMNDAHTRFESGDYLGARYFANLALSNNPDSEDAKDLLELADVEIEESISRDQAVERGLFMADSLMSYGEIEEALVVIRSLMTVAGEDGRVHLALKKTEFAFWQAAADKALSRADYRGAAAAVDSAAMRFPDHKWCVNLRSRIAQETAPRAAGPGKAQKGEAAQKAKELSVEMRKEVAAAYKRGQELFEQGQLSAAVDEWERVETLAPGYMSVRDYLVDAYKFLGVELYTENRLSEALDVWQKAARLAPDSTEIAGYIKRTRHEISKLEEISYERR